MIEWLKNAVFPFMGALCTPAFIFAFGDLIVSTFFQIAFGRFGMKIRKNESTNTMTSGGGNG